MANPDNRLDFEDFTDTHIPSIPKKRGRKPLNKTVLTILGALGLMAITIIGTMIVNRMEEANAAIKKVAVIEAIMPQMVKSFDEFRSEFKAELKEVREEVKGLRADVKARGK